MARHLDICCAGSFVGAHVVRQLPVLEMLLWCDIYIATRVIGTVA
jgi:hypothetical protein